jgi:nucleoside-diphosphate-sugar epimerase
MARVLVTGASGFVGRHVVEQLAGRGHEVHAVARAGVGADVPGVRWHAADLLDGASAAALVREVAAEALLHLAWYAEPGAFWRSPENVRWVEASLALARAFVDAGGRRLVVAGTCAEYDWHDGLCSEASTPLAPATLYGRSKHALEIVLSGLAVEAPLSFAWGRIFFVYGPGEHPARLTASVVGALLRGEPARLSAGTQVRDFLHVADVAGAFVALVESDVQGPVNVGWGDPTPVRRLAELVAEIVGRPELLRLGALGAAGEEPPLVVADPRRLRDDVGFTPRFDLRTGLQDTVDHAVAASRA